VTGRSGGSPARWDVSPTGTTASVRSPGRRPESSRRVRASSALALGNIGPDAEKAIRRLKRALDDDNADVRYSAVTALERIGTPKALKALGPRRRR